MSSSKASNEVMEDLQKEPSLNLSLYSVSNWPGCPSPVSTARRERFLCDGLELSEIRPVVQSEVSSREI